MSRIVLAALALLLAPAAQAASGAPALDEAVSGRRILVMLRLAPEHYRLGSDYAGGYGGVLGASARQRAARRVAGRQGLTVVDSWPMPVLGVDCVVMEVAAGRSVADAIARASRDPDVAWSQPLNRFETSGAAAGRADPLLPAQPAAKAWRLDALHRYATGRGIRVAVIDSKVERTHPDLVGRVATSRDFTTAPPAAAEAHGTAVAGLIAATADNGAGIVGIAPRADILALRACWEPTRGSDRTVCDSLSLAKALQFAIEARAGVTNLSLGGPFDLLLARLLDAGQARGTVMVAAFDRRLPDGGFPASAPGVIAVAEGSGAPPGVYAAPGRGLPAPGRGGWRLVDGSSYAAAQVSGLIALMRERGAARDVAGALATARGADGTIDACRAVLAAAEGDCARAIGPVAAAAR